MKIDYSKLDASILEVIQRLSPAQFFQIEASLFKETGEFKAQLDAKPGAIPADQFRIIDRRLKALKKAGKITFLRKGWVLK